MPTKVTCETFGKYGDEKNTKKFVQRYTLANGWMTVQIINYGATITALKIPDKNGILDDIVLGFDDIEGYYNNTAYIGATVGRVCNRIALGKFNLNGKQYKLSVNRPPNHLHGGIKGFDKVLWNSSVEDNQVVMRYASESGEEGYPGKVEIKVSFALSDKNEVIIHYTATTSEPTPLSLTNHSYFNLAGHLAPETIDHHLIYINADSYTPVNEFTIPTGDVTSVDGTGFDLRSPIYFSESLKKTEYEGFDNNFCISDNEKVAARVIHPKSGRQIEVMTSLPGLQLYTANFFPTDDTLKGKQNIFYKKHGALCLETQHYPNAINQPNFPSCVLHLGEVYNHKTIYKFAVN